MDSVPDVSVCIVNWNCRDLLRDALASLHRQEQGVHIETIVVDNASVDGAADMVAAEFPEVVLLRNAVNHGFARGNNQAAARATGRYLFFLNNDTRVPPRTLAKLLAYAEGHPEVGMIGPRLRDDKGQFQISYRLRPTLGSLLHRTNLFGSTGLFRRAHRRYRRDTFDPHSTRPVETLMGAALFLSRTVFDRCGPWDEDFAFGGEDLHFSTCVGRRYALMFLSDAEIIHYGGVSTRQHIGYAASNRLAGYAHFLRKTGYSRLAVLAYKLTITLDAPVEVLVKGAQYLVRRLRGKVGPARKSLLACRGALHFLTRGLVGFWRA
jgi:GT2 family glycosyltransferase